MNQKKKVNWYLVSATVLYALDGNETVGMMPINAAVFSEDPDRLIRLRLISRAQQAAQIQFLKKLNDIKVQIRDVVINNMTYLGNMSQEQFNETPPGMEVREMSVNDSEGHGG